MTQQQPAYCEDLVAVTREVTKSGDLFWVVWKNNEVIAEESSEFAALVIARVASQGYQQ